MTDQHHQHEADTLLEKALAAASDTRLLRVADGIRHDAAQVFPSLFDNRKAILVADENTYRVAGRDVQAGFEQADRLAATVVFGPDIYAEWAFVEKLQAELERVDAIPVAVGSGTINDLTKLASHRVNRPYMVVATAASMDGYTSFGASITYEAAKQTFSCPAPRGVLGDLEVIAGAPAGMNASGYADLLAKNVGGADWILADAAGADPIDERAWTTVHGLLRSWVGSPAAIARDEPAALRHLLTGLMMSGFAMQDLQSSRPASGAEHYFSHLWDMQHHTHNGVVPSHGFKVGIGTLASLALHEHLLTRDIEHLDIERAVSSWPALADLENEIGILFPVGPMRDRALSETSAKYSSPDEVRLQLTRLRDRWPDVRTRLKQHLIPFSEVHAMLRDAGCPNEPEQIGISRERLLNTARQAVFLRNRFTVLDFAQRTGLAEAALASLFGPAGRWAIPVPHAG